MYVLHTMPDTAGLVVHITLRELAVPFRLNLIDRASGERDGAAFRAINPTGKVPVLETPDGAIFETAAILLWLGERHPGLCPPPGDPKRGDFLKWLLFTTFGPHVGLMQLTYPERHVATPDAVPPFLETTTQRVRAEFSVLDTAFATETCPAPVPSILGYYLAMLFRWMLQFPPGHAARSSAASWPALLALARGLETRAAVLDTARAEGMPGRHLFSDPV